MFDALKKKISQKTDQIIKEIKLPESVRNERFDICKSCDQFNSMEFCKICHCYMPAKTYLPFDSCPINKWGKVEIE